MKIKFLSRLYVGLSLLLTILTISCNFDNEVVLPPTKVGSVFIINEGNWGASNATLSTYDPSTNEVVSDLFFTANKAPLGDTPTSVSFYNGSAYITLSGSGKIYVINPLTGKLVSKITDLYSPRYMVGAGGTKVYVSNLGISVNDQKASHIDVISLATNTKVKEIKLQQGQYAEQFIRVGDYIYANCWSYGTEILKIDVRTDEVVGSVKVGIQPMNLVLDSKNRLWTMTDGGYYDGPLGFEDPTLVCVDLNLNIIKTYPVKRNPNAMMHKMAMSNGADELYFTNLNLFKLDIGGEQLPTDLPTEAFVNLHLNNVSNLAVDPEKGDIYIGDAVDFTQNGAVLRYDKTGKLLNTFSVGVCPGGFAFSMTW